MAFNFDWLLDIAVWRPAREGLECCDFAMSDFRARSGLRFTSDWQPHFVRWAQRDHATILLHYSARPMPSRHGIPFVQVSRRRNPAKNSAAMTLLSNAQDQILLLHDQGKRPRRMLVPAAYRADFEREMRRGLSARSSNELPLHIMGVLLHFTDVEEIVFEYDGGVSRG